MRIYIIRHAGPDYENDTITHSSRPPGGQSAGKADASGKHRQPLLLSLAESSAHVILHPEDVL